MGDPPGRSVSGDPTQTHQKKDCLTLLLHSVHRVQTCEYRETATWRIKSVRQIISGYHDDHKTMTGVLQ